MAYKVVRAPQMQVDIDGKVKEEAAGTTLEIANERHIGGVAPLPRTNEMQPVVVDDSGRLYTKAPEPYKLPVATSAILGGVKPTPKTTLMQAPVGIDPEGGLWSTVVQGERGPQGPQGERGPKGEAGQQGPQGVQGERASTALIIWMAEAAVTAFLFTKETMGFCIKRDDNNIYRYGQNQYNTAISNNMVKCCHYTETRYADPLYGEIELKPENCLFINENDFDTLRFGYDFDEEKTKKWLKEYQFDHFNSIEKGYYYYFNYDMKTYLDFTIKMIFAAKWAFDYNLAK